MTKEEYQYILNKLTRAVYPKGFLCMYEEDKICVCLTKAYFRFVVEQLGKLLEDEDIYDNFVKCEREDCPKNKICEKRKEEGKCFPICDDMCLREPYVFLDEEEIEMHLASKHPNSIYSEYRFKYSDYIITILRDVENCAFDDDTKKNVLLLFINFLNNGDENIPLKNEQRLNEFKQGIKKIHQKELVESLYKKSFEKLLNKQFTKVPFSQTNLDFDDLVYSVFLKIISDWVNPKIDDKASEKNMFRFLTEQIMKY